MSAAKTYAMLLEDLDRLEASLNENPKRTTTFSERETIGAAWTSLRKMCQQHDKLVAALKMAYVQVLPKSAREEIGALLREIGETS